MDDAGARGSTHYYWITGQVSFGDGGKDTILFMADVNELDLAVAVQSVDDGV
jgi:hypothetical protein